MRFVGLILACGAVFLSGCGFLHTAEDVATAPLRLFHHETPTPTPTPLPKRSARSRSSAQQNPVTPLPHRSTRYSKVSPTPSEKKETTPAEAKTEPVKTKATSPAAPPPAEQDFPTAKTVPDKPGYVFSPYEPTKYVDVTGYASGSKVKDPYSGKIFLVP